MTVEIGGKRYEGRYTVAAKVVTVTYGLRSKATQEGGSGLESIAKVLLAELVREEGAETDNPAPDVQQAQVAAHSYVTTQNRATPGREVTDHEIEQQLVGEGFSRGAISEALRLRKKNKKG